MVLSAIFSFSTSLSDDIIRMLVDDALLCIYGCIGNFLNLTYWNLSESSRFVIVYKSFIFINPVRYESGADKKIIIYRASKCLPIQIRDVYTNFGGMFVLTYTSK